MIYVGYQGVGKSTIAGKHKCIDLESSCFLIDGKKVTDWEKIYVNIAEELSSQGYNVFISSHKEVREELVMRGEHFAIIYPSLDLKDEWINRLHNRYGVTKSYKDERAYKRALVHYEDDINDINGMCMRHSGIETIELLNLNYDLLSIVKEEEI